MSKKVFISYASQDYSTARLLSNKLVQQGIQVAAIDDVVALESKSISAIKEAGALIILLSQNSQSSSWIAFEVGVAMARGIKIMPVLLTENKEDIPTYLRHIQLHELGSELYEELKKIH